MTVRRSRTALIALVLSAAFFGVPPRAVADESPAGRIIAHVVPMNNNIHSSQEILAVMHCRAGQRYDENTLYEDMRRLDAKHWFQPGSIKPSVVVDSTGQVNVYIHVSELVATVQEVVYLGAQHISPKDLANLSQIRKGDPLSTTANELARTEILRKYQEEQGRWHTTVELLEGSKPKDTRVVFRITEGKVVRVAAVEFRGNKAAQSGRLKEQLLTKKAHFNLIGGKFNRLTIDSDIKQLKEYYARLGYLHVRINEQIEFSEDLSRVTITYFIEEGVQARVSSVEVVNPLRDASGIQTIGGLTTFSNDRLAGTTALQPGQRYDEGIVQGDIKQLTNYYGYRGHKVNVDKFTVDDQNDPALVHMQYVVQGDRGQPNRVGRVILAGNSVTRDKVIMRQLGLLPGQILQYPMLEQARMRLARLGIFDQNAPPDVQVLPGDNDSGFKDILVTVQETRTGQFMVGGGLNSNSGVSGNIAINERNFDILRFPTSIDDFIQGRAFRGNGQELRINAMPGTQYQQYNATFRDPYLFDTNFGFTNSINFFQRSYIEYFENRIGDRATLTRQLSPAWQANFTTRVEEVEVKNVPTFAPPSITDNLGWHFLVGFRAGLTRDTRDSYLYPSRGNVFDIGFEQVTGDYTYPIATTRFTQFITTNQRDDGSGKHVLAMRTQLSIAGSQTPVYDRFYAGGFGTIRGFTYRGIGPEFDGLHTGGTFSFLNTIEYQIPILPNDKLFFVTFLDHGTVEQNIDIKNYRVTAGFGFRIAVPMFGPMPIALDFGFPVNKMAGDNTQMFSFYMGMFN